MTEEEFRERVIPMQGRMYGLALRIGMTPEDAADMVQETQVRLWRHRARIPEDSKELVLYCLAAMRNECLSHLRRRRQESSLDEALGLTAPVEEDCEYRDSRERIEMLIDSLPRGQRQVIRLSGFGGYESSEIAKATGQTENNVRQLLSRGRRRLRELLEKSN